MIGEQILGPSPMIRDAQAPEQDEAAFINKWLAKIQGAKKFFKDDFIRMREDMDFAYGKQWDDGTGVTMGNKYTANIVQQHIKQRVAALYARNPTFVAKRRRSMDFAVWDENPDTLSLLQTTFMQDPLDPGIQNLFKTMTQDIQQGATKQEVFKRLSVTMELVLEDQIKEQHPNFKKQMKQLIRRIETTGVGYLKLDYQRTTKHRPDIETQISDFSGRLATLKRLMADRVDGKTEEMSAEAFELEKSLEALEREEQILLREGLVVSFPFSTALILDPRCRGLEGFLGADWIAEEFLLSPDEIKEIYNVDIGSSFNAFSISGDREGEDRKIGMLNPHTVGGLFEGSVDAFSRVYLVWDKKTGTHFALAQGYSNFLLPPEAPNVTTETFYPFIPLMFNQVEHEEKIYPLSDVRLLRHVQKEYNRSKEALRQHRIASAPLYVSAGGVFGEEDQTNLALHLPHECVVVEGLAEGEDVNSKLQMVKKHNIDPNVYETNHLFDDLTRIVGVQEANLGAISGATATETSLAEDTRLSSLSSNADDLDEFLSEFARIAGQILLKEMDIETVKERVGPGAVWPQFSKEQIADELAIEIKAGSSGRPNKMQKAVALERLQPILMQMPGVNPRWLFEQIVDTVDENIDITEAFIEGLPSITAQNQMQQPGTGDPATDPTAQGAEGADNTATGVDPRAGAKAEVPGPVADPNFLIN